MSKELELGEVIKCGNTTVVVAGMKNHEKFGDCCYDREYLLCEEKYMREHCGFMREDDLEKHGWWLEVTGSSFPEFERVDGVVPYAIEPVECVSIRKMRPKTITTTVFE